MTDQMQPPASKPSQSRESGSGNVPKQAEWPIDWLRQTSPYINTHRGKTFVVWFGGDMFEAGGFDALVHDLTLLSHLGIKLVLVHGMRAQIDAELASRGITPKFGPAADKSGNQTVSNCQKMRITGEETLSAIRSVMADLRCKLESAFSTGLANSPMSGAQISIASGNFIVAKPYGIRNAIDYQHTGEIRKIRKQNIKALMKAGMVVLLSPVGYSRTGEMFNLLSEDVAMHTATALSADKLIYLHKNGSAIDRSMREISAIENFSDMTRQLTSQTELQSLQMVIERSILACRNGVDRCHVVDAKQSDALLRELFTRDGSGLLIDTGDYDTIRVADTGNVEGIMALIAPLIKDGTLAKRTKQDLEREIQKFYIIEREGSVICCASLDNFGDTAELACLAVHPDFRASGKASDMLDHLIKAAKKQQCKSLFVLSTRSGDWFLEQGFKETGTASLPKERTTQNQRRSKMYTIDLC